MKVTFGVSTTLSIGLAALVTVPAATAQNSYYYAGQAAGGQPLMVDLGSITSVGERDANFDYVLGEALVAGQAHCAGSGAWTTLSDGVVHYAQSQAMREMLRVVCSYSSASAAVESLPPASVDVPGDVAVDVAVERSPDLSTPSAEPSLSDASSSESSLSVQTALVYDPSSNVRATPNGQILCSIDTRAYINIYGHLGDWYNTDACGTLGVIHISQIQF